MFSPHLTCLYAQEKPSTILGGIVTVGVIAGLVAYTIYVVLAYMNRCGAGNSVAERKQASMGMGLCG